MFALSKKPKIPDDEVDDETRIHDTRNIKEFQGITFSGFKRSSVKKQFYKSLMNQHTIEDACFWCAQLLSCGCLMEIWEIILLVMSQTIHMANPKLPLYVKMRFEQFRDILTTPRKNRVYTNDCEHLLRNNQMIRELFGELCAVICVSRKKQEQKSISVRDQDFDMFHLPNLLKAPTPNYIHFSSPLFKHGIWTKEDPQELMVASNELAYHVSEDGKDEQHAKYWVEWILGYLQRIERQKRTRGKEGKAQKIICLCSPRKHCVGGRDLSRESLCHPIWVVWDILLNEASRRDEKETKNYTKVINALMELFGIRFTKGCVKRRKFIVYMAIMILCEPIDWTLNIVSDSYKSVVSLTKQNIHVVYKQLKKDEIVKESTSIQDNYLMNNSLLSFESNTQPANTRIANIRTANTQSQLHPQPSNSPKKGMPITDWERNQIAEMIVERDDCRT